MPTTPTRRSQRLPAPAPQRLSWWQRLAAAILNRRHLAPSAFIAVLVVVITVAINLAYITSHVPVTGWYDAIIKAVTFLTLTNLSNASQDSLGSALIVFNLLFTVIFAQSLLETARGFIFPLPVKDRQDGVATTLTNHTIVCGLGRVGYRVAMRLVEAGEDVVVIEQSWTAPFVLRMVELGVPVIVGDARDAATLRRAGIQRAKNILAIIDGDLLNLEIVLAAHKINPQAKVILRAFNEAFDSGIERSFGKNTAFSVSALAAPTFTAATVARNLVYLLTPGPTSKDVLGVMRLEIPGHLALNDPTLNREMAGQARLIHHERQDKATVLGLVGPLAKLEEVRVNLEGNLPTTRPRLQTSSGPNTVIVCGLGKVGYRLVQRLSEMDTGVQITVIQKREDADSPFTKTVERLPKVKLIYGDARDAAVLRQAGLDDALAVAAVTSDDEQNVRMALEARRLHPKVHIVLRVFSEELAEELADLFGILTVYSVSNLAGPTLAAAAIIPGVQQGFVIDRHFYAMHTLRVTASSGSPLTIGQLHQSTQATVVGVHRGPQFSLMPPETFPLQPGDRVALVATLPQLRMLLGRKDLPLFADQESIAS